MNDADTRNRRSLDRALEFLKSEIWPSTADLPPISKGDREEILGYTDRGFSI
jgi:hypothetical protein